MRLSYDGLWKMLFNLNVSKMEFAKSIGISNATLAKLGKDEPVALTVLMRICEHYNCKIENIVKFIPDNKEMYPDILGLEVGTILICTAYPLGTSVISMNLSRRTNILKKHPCVILEKCFRDGYVPKLLVAPLFYNLTPDTIFDIRFKSLELDNDIIECGYIEIGKMGYVMQKDCENVIGMMPEKYMNDAISLLEKLKPLLERYERC